MWVIPSWSYIYNLSHPSRVRGLKCLLRLFLKYYQQSHPSRVRGLKYWEDSEGFNILQVAPFAGAWNEISQKYDITITDKVAPFAGAWIEIFSASRGFKASKVAPFAGAWIEICTRWWAFYKEVCRTLRGCVDWNKWKK